MTPDTARLFLGLELSGEARNALDSVRRELQSAGSIGKFHSASLYHLTLVFLGNTPVSLIPSIERIMNRVPAAPFDLTLSSLGTFKNGSILWAGVRECPALMEYQKSLADALRKAGFPLEETGYSPDQGVASFWLDGVMYGFYQPSPGSAKDSYILRTITIQAGSEARTFRDIGLDTSLEEALARFPGKVTDWEWAINDLYDRGASRGWLEYGQGNYGLRMTAPEGTVHLTFSGKTHQMKYIWLYGPGL